MGNSPEFGLAVMNRVIKKAGAERVSDEASDTLRTILEEIANNLSKTAIDLANHAGRKTIKSEDILLAYKNSYKNEEISSRLFKRI
jgi:DNA-binding protein